MSTKTNNLKMALPTGTENITRSVINGNFEIVDAAVGSVQDGLAIVSDGDTHGAIANGQFVYVRNHNTLAEGLYKARAAIGANVALSTSNLTANGSGGLNDLQSQVNALNSQKADKTTVNALIKTKIQSVTFDNNGAWGAWGTDVDMAGYALIYASPNTWAPTTILCDKDGFYSLSCPSKAGQTVTYKLVGINANVVH